MYQCKTPPIGTRKPKKVLQEAREFIDKWRAESSGARPYVRVRFLPRHQRVFIDDFHYHIESKKLENMVGRYRLLPCVKELLKHSTDKPTPTEHGNLLLDGLTPEGEPFRVIIRPEKKGGTLQSFYPN
jgi:hypothetical protein